MPDDKGETKVKDPPETTLHAYKDGRSEDVIDDPTLHGEPPEHSPLREEEPRAQTRTGPPEDPEGVSSGGPVTEESPDGDSTAEQGLGTATGGSGGGSRPD